MGTTYEHSHGVSDPFVDAVPSPSIHNRVFSQFRRGLERLEGKAVVPVIQIGIGVCPRGLADRGPNELFFDVGGGFVVAG